MAADVSIVALNQAIRGQGRVFKKNHTISTTVNAASRSALQNVTGILYNQLRIVGISVSSEYNTNWRIKFYSKDTGIVTAYSDNTYIGELQIVALSSNANSVYEGDVESDLFYIDSDNTNEIHLIAENIGANNSKLYLTIMYTEAD